MADSNDKKHVEIDEVKEFSGGSIKSIEPIAEGDTEHGVHGDFHSYSGGQVLERTDTSVSPWIWGFWAIVICTIIGTLIVGGFIPGFRFGSKGYAVPVGTTAAGYNDVESVMKAHADFVALTSPAYIDMYELPRPTGQALDGNNGAIAAGSKIYQSYCIGCHGPNQDGAGPNAVSLNPSPRNLRNADFMQALSYQRIWTSIHKGVPGTAMPRWENTLNDDQIRDVICYVFSLTAPADPRTGKFIRPTQADLAGQSAATASGATDAAPAT